MKIRKALILLFILSFFESFAQKIGNVDFTVNNNVIVVTYDLVNCPKGKTYDVKLEIIGENGTYLPKTVSGDLGKVSPGKGKTIEWNVLNDETEIKDKIRVKVEITKSYSKYFGGPANVVFSMILPGTGDYFVNKNNQIIGAGISILFVGSVCYAIYSKNEQNKYYTDYHNATEQSVMDNTYTKANNNHHMYLLATSLASAIWLGDVVHVLVRGMNNQKEKQKNAYSFNSIMKNLFFSYNSNSCQIGLIKRF